MADVNAKPRHVLQQNEKATETWKKTYCSFLDKHNMYDFFIINTFKNETCIGVFFSHKNKMVSLISLLHKYHAEANYVKLNQKSQGDFFVHSSVYLFQCFHHSVHCVCVCMCEIHLEPLHSSMACVRFYIVVLPWNFWTIVYITVFTSELPSSWGPVILCTSRPNMFTHWVLLSKGFFALCPTW